MIDAGDQIVTEVEYAVQGGCTEAAFLTKSVKDYLDSADSYFSYVGMVIFFIHFFFLKSNCILEKVPEITDKIADGMRKYGIDKKNQIIWDFFGCILLFLFIFLVGYICGSKWILRFSMFITFFLILALLLVSVVLNIILVSFQ